MNSNVENLTRFARSIGRCILRWPHRGTRPPVAWRRWRRAFTIVQRFSMYYDAGLLTDEQRQIFDRIFEQAHAEEQRLWAEWREYKRCTEMRFLTGRRKRCPRWCSC